MMDVHYESQGYNRISRDRVTKLDQSITKGIDGVYEDAGPPPKFIIAEAKYNRSRLKQTKSGKQMGDPWVHSSKRLEKALGEEKLLELELELMKNPECLKKQLFKVKPNGKTLVHDLDKYGNTK